MIVAAPIARPVTAVPSPVTVADGGIGTTPGARSGAVALTTGDTLFAGSVWRTVSTSPSTCADDSVAV